MDPRELAAALYVSSPDEPEPDAEAHRRRALREEIALLERLVSELAPAPIREPEPHPRGPRILSTDELEAVRAELIARLARS